MTGRQCRRSTRVLSHVQCCTLGGGRAVAGAAVCGVRAAAWCSVECGACIVGRWFHAGLGWSWMLRTMRREPCAVCVMRDTHGRHAACAMGMAMRHAMGIVIKLYVSVGKQVVYSCNSQVARLGLRLRARQTSDDTRQYFSNGALAHPLGLTQSDMASLLPGRPRLGTWALAEQSADALGVPQ